MLPMNWMLAGLLNLTCEIHWLFAVQSALRPFQGVGPISARNTITAAWLVFLVFWFVAAFNRKATQRREPIERRLVLVVFMGAAFFLLFGNANWQGRLHERFLPDLQWIVELGALLTVLGIAFAIWARVHIGRNWSGQVMIKQDHELIRTGPYARIRHPIYSGLLLAVLGSCLALGEYRALEGFAIILFGLIYKAKREEAILAEHFGPAFEEHKKHTGFFLPRFT